MVELTVELFACECIIVEFVEFEIVVEKAVVFCGIDEGFRIVDSYIGVIIFGSDVVIPANKQSSLAIVHFRFSRRYFCKSFMSFGDCIFLRQAVYWRLQTFDNVENDSVDNDVVDVESDVVDGNDVHPALAGFGVENKTGAKSTSSFLQVIM